MSQDEAATAARPELAAYYFPNYHDGDPRNERWHGAGWTEWELLKRAEPRFPGHRQPRIPAWGYEDESLPPVMARKMAAAAEAGLNAFIFDWYWYEDGPYLERALEKGFLGANNPAGLKFALMWANHDWVDLHPATSNTPPRILASGDISETAFREATDYMIERYFCSPAYWRVGGGLYLSFYMIAGLVSGFGDVESARRALEDFRSRVRAAGFGELHLNAVVWGEQILPGEEKVQDIDGLLAKLGFDSITSYVWIHNQKMPAFPITDYAMYRDMNVPDFPALTDRYRLPYFPNLTVGWDSSPRTVQSDLYRKAEYPFLPVLAGNSPDEFEKALIAARDFLASGETKPPVLTINAWNEWTEGSYLEPDTDYGTGYLDAIRRVFGSRGHQ